MHSKGTDRRSTSSPRERGRDNLTPKQRSHCMSRIRSTDTSPEVTVRRMLFAMGYRFRLHAQGLPGRPDIVLTRHRKIILVHGCFWHTHRCKYGHVVPKTNAEYWAKKRDGNVQRDRANRRKLRKMGWGVLVVWECWTKDMAKLEDRLRRFLSGKRTSCSRT